MKPAVEVSVEAGDWSEVGNPQDLAQAAVCIAAEESGRNVAPNSEVSVLFCDDETICTLNRRWRGIDKATNVLSFPAAAGPASAPLLGDIVIAFETSAKEAAQKGIPLRDHVAHLLIHGFLHLVGHDHAEDASAEAMEAIERAALARLGFADPYPAPLTEARASTHE
jgi:probable rRNA maturation factor